jgi:hypothetical protein
MASALINNLMQRQDLNQGFSLGSEHMSMKELENGNFSEKLSFQYTEGPST